MRQKVVLTNKSCNYRQNTNIFFQERQRYNVYPLKELTWSWTHYFNVTDTKVVIIGKSSWTDGSDPHTLRQAHGLSFSVKRGCNIPISTANMFKELERDSYITFTRPKHGCLEGWAKQGVLLLNTILTTRSANSTRETVNSHKVSNQICLMRRYLNASECDQHSDQ